MKQAQTQRDSFFNELYNLGSKDNNFYFVASDQGAPSLDQYREGLSRRFIDAGISEQNAILLASGLAFEGRNVYAHAIANFITLRCLEQIRVELSMMELPVKIVGVGAGYSYDDSGPTHHSTEDLAIMRALPNMTIFNVSDSVMAKQVAQLTYKTNRPCYIRLDRKLSPSIHKEDLDIAKGWETLASGDDLTLVATGNMVHTSLELRERLKQIGVAARVIEVYRLPIDDSLKSEVYEKHEYFTLEEHYLPGGFGSAFLEKVSEWQVVTPVTCLGVLHAQGYCYRYGGREILQKHQGVEIENLYQRICTKLKRG